MIAVEFLIETEWTHCSLRSKPAKACESLQLQRVRVCVGKPALRSSQPPDTRSGAGKLDLHVQKSEIRPFAHTTHKQQLKMD